MSGGSSLFVAEPPAAYLYRPAVVVDCSVLSALLFEEPNRDRAAHGLAGKAWHAPHLLDHEVCSVAHKKVRLGVSADLVASALRDFEAFDIARHGTDIAGQYALAVQYKLSTYDAAYLWLAAHLKVPLATFDEKLARAAAAHLADL